MAAGCTKDAGMDPCLRRDDASDAGMTGPAGICFCGVRVSTVPALGTGQGGQLLRLPEWRGLEMKDETRPGWCAVSIAMLAENQQPVVGLGARRQTLAFSKLPLLSSMLWAMRMTTSLGI